MARLRETLKELIEKAGGFGLPEQDLHAATEYLKYGEYELCLDQLTTQLYEYDVAIDQAYWALTEKAATALKLAPAKINYLKELVSN